VEEEENDEGEKRINRRVENALFPRDLRAAKVVWLDKPHGLEALARFRRLGFLQESSESHR
jgi:hypothetical protein